MEFDIDHVTLPNQHCPIWQCLLLSKAENLTSKKLVNHDKTDFATKQSIFGLLTIDESPLVSMTNSRPLSAGLSRYRFF